MKIQRISLVIIAGMLATACLTGPIAIVTPYEGPPVSFSRLTLIHEETENLDARVRNDRTGRRIKELPSMMKSELLGSAEFEDGHGGLVIRSRVIYLPGVTIGDQGGSMKSRMPDKVYLAITFEDHGGSKLSEISVDTLRRGWLKYLGDYTRAKFGQANK